MKTRTFFFLSVFASTKRQSHPQRLYGIEIEKILGKMLTQGCQYNILPLAQFVYLFPLVLAFITLSLYQILFVAQYRVLSKILFCFSFRDVTKKRKCQVFCSDFFLLTSSHITGQELSEELER